MPIQYVERNIYLQPGWGSYPLKPAYSGQRIIDCLPGGVETSLGMVLGMSLCWMAVGSLGFSRSGGVKVMGDIMERRKAEGRRQFLSLSPLERLQTMEEVFNDILKIKSRAEGVSEYEIYKRYLRKDQRDI